MAIPLQNINIQVPVAEGRYELTQIPAIVQPNVTLSAGQQTSKFEIPADMVFNFSKSYLAFKVTIGNSPVNVRQAIFADTPAMIQSITIKAKSARQTLLEITDVPSFFKIVAKAMTPLSEYLTLDSSAAVTGAHADGTTTPFLRKNESATLGLGFSYPTANVANSNPYLGPLYYHAAAAHTNTVGPLNVLIPLNLFAHTILALNKDLCFDRDQLEFTIQWSPKSRVGWNFDEGVNVTVNAAALTAAIAIDNMYLYVARQMLDSAIKRVTDEIVGGLSIILPWVRQDAVTLTATTQEPTFQIGESNGLKMNRIYYSPCDNIGADQYAVDCDNRGASKITTIKTKIDGVMKEQVDVDIASGQSYLLNREYLRGSVIQDATDYHANYMYILDWSQEEGNPLETAMNPLHYNKLVGLDLNKTRTVTFTVNATADYRTGGARGGINHRVIICTQRMMTIRKDAPVMIV